MESLERVNEGWNIIGAIKLDSVFEGLEVVLGHNPNNPCTPYVTWECTSGDNYYWGHYFKEKQDAFEDWCKRIAKYI